MKIATTIPIFGIQCDVSGVDIRNLSKEQVWGILVKDFNQNLDGKIACDRVGRRVYVGMGQFKWDSSSFQTSNFSKSCKCNWYWRRMRVRQEVGLWGVFEAIYGILKLKRQRMLVLMQCSIILLCTLSVDSHYHDGLKVLWIIIL